MKIQKIILVIIIYYYLMMVVSAETYITYVDDELGFYKVRDITMPTNKFIYKNHILTIDQGDTIIWENDATKTSFTIISEQGLWDEKVGYLRVGSKLNYKFDKPGKYKFYIKEHKSVLQTVIVNMVDTTNITTTPINTPINAPNITTTPINIPINTPINAPNITTIHITTNSVGTKPPIKISPTTVVSILVALLSIIIMYKVGRNRR